MLSFTSQPGEARHWIVGNGVDTIASVHEIGTDFEVHISGALRVAELEGITAFIQTKRVRRLSKAA